MILDVVKTGDGVYFSGSDKDTLKIVRERGGTITKLEIPKKRVEVAAMLNNLTAELRAIDAGLLED